MENDTCEGFSRSALIVFSSTNYAAIAVCVLAGVLVFALKLHRKSVYRLALYQDMAALFYATQCGLQLILLRYDTPSAIQAYRPSCALFGWWHMYSLWVKLLLSLCVAFHLFYLAVFHKNLKKFEVVYLGISLLVPAVISVVPFTTQSYGLAGSWCWVEIAIGGCSNETSFIGLVEQFALWFGPSITLAFISSSAMAVMVGVLLYRACTHSRHVLGPRGDQNWKALKQVLPLAAYPIVTFVFFVPSFLNRVHGATSHTVSLPLSVLSASGAAGWSIAPGVTLILHISIAGLCAKKHSQKKEVHGHYHRYSSSDEGGGALTVGKVEMKIETSSITRFPFPEESVGIDDHGASPPCLRTTNRIN